MALATGVFKQVSFKREATYGVAPGAAGFQLARRVQSTIDLSKDVYQSAEIRPDLQTADYRHGVRRIKGALQGELSPGTYADIFAAMVKREFVAGVSIALGATTLAIGGAGPTYTLTRSGGSWIADGIKAFDVVRVTVGAALTPANLNKNIMVVSLTATVLTVVVLNGSVMATDGAQATCTVAVTGKKTYIPAAGHTDISYSFEHWYNDITQGELFTGIKFDKAALSLPPTGLATVNFDVMGKDITTSASRYGTSPTVVTTAPVVAAVNGVLLVNGAAVAIVTGLQIELDPMFSGDPVVGSNTVPVLFPGRVSVMGSFTAYFQDATLRDLFVNETESSLAVALTTSNLANADFMTVVLPRLKVGSANKGDGEAGLVQTFSFQALYNNTLGSTADATTLAIQDSLA